MKYPKIIQKNDQIIMVAPSLGATIEPYLTYIKNAKTFLEKNGFKVKYGPNVFLNNGILSNTPIKCGEEINDAFTDKNNDFVISVGGGEVMCEILPYVNFDYLKENPKWFMGFSDNTNLTFLLPTLVDVASIYGCNAGAFGRELTDDVIDTFHLIKGQKLTIQSYKRYQEVSLRTEEDPFAPINFDSDSLKKYFPDNFSPFTGRLIGGCLDCLINLCGTRFDNVKAFLEKYKEDGFIWFLEACDLNVLGIRRAFFQLDQAGWFKYVKGFIIGRPYNASEEMFGIDKYQAVLDTISKYDVPIIFDADLGHKPLSMPFITGSIATVTRVDKEFMVEMKLK